MSEGRPAYRGALCKAVLRQLREQPGWGAGVLGRVPHEVTSTLAAANGLGWLPAQLLDTLNQALLEVAGEDEYVGFWRRHTVASVDTRLLGPLFQGAIRIFGLEPGGLIGWFGRAWEVTTRDYGHIITRQGEASVAVELLELPRRGRLRTVALSAKGSVHGIMQITKRSGMVHVDSSKLESAGRVVLEASWAVA